MPRLPRLNSRQMLLALTQAGWYEERQIGSHVQLRHSERPGTVTVPVHAGLVLSPGVVSQILRQAGMTADELRRLR